MSFQAFFSQEFTEEFGKLVGSTRKIAEKRIRKILAHPELGKPLKGESNLYSERLLFLRIIYKIEGNSITFLRVGKRDSVYRDLR